jgi:hypothetical protein
VVNHSRRIGRLTRSFRACELWSKIYPSLSAERPGLFGAITGRAEAQVVRLSGLYAVLDRSCVIRVRHLKAALAVWLYCEDSARYLFGDATGNPLADKIYRALRAARIGLTRTQIRDLLGRNVKRDEIDRGLMLLREYGMAVAIFKKTRGRSIELWVSSFRSYMSSATGVDEIKTRHIANTDKGKGVVPRRHKRPRTSSSDDRFQLPPELATALGSLERPEPTER